MNDNEFNCPYIFKSSFCGYAGPEIDCNKTAEQCLERKNFQRFGGHLNIFKEDIFCSFCRATFSAIIHRDLRATCPHCGKINELKDN